ncbi:MAG: hypothetical protein CO105_12355 [Comamonadaceae bacterium CG_4_9_14_3_um_filter_60_33]|nr:MAG: hypothetical protein AUK51_16290 [Comamonadaceae bacterium CG2_30_59_20]PIY28304.1 MAG: hypothetical protein COZ09_10840 [Comamonadaceae bacterium CG_4_10_14_3_um_filter_60_42]PJB41892.1 MAG: hypothetical protein CO105_12355 [Comamonadaceae bacterium CG_4_9_14_3_um_filter_60_33]
MHDSLALKNTTTDFKRTLSLVQGLPFDMAREQYAKAVQMGLIQRSMLAWAKFERQIDMLEKITLGPWARRV